MFAQPGAPLEPELAPFCSYEWAGDGAADASKLPSQAGKKGTDWLGRDCFVVTGLAASEDAQKAVSVPLQAAFRKSLETPAGPLSPAAGGGSRVRVAVVDTWPDVARVGLSPHGFGMGSIIEDLTCELLGSPAVCPIRVVPALALNLEAPGDPNNVRGGYFGFQGHLARILVEAERGWKSEDPQSHLIVNMSIGWDEEFNDGAYEPGPEGPMSAAVLAVRTAIEVGVCKGALFIASAGNARGGPVPGQGPMYPAAWEKTAAPACVQTPNSSLLYAAGGVDGRDAPIHNARPLAQPVLAAPSYAVPTTGTTAGPAPVTVGPFTGTSVSAAVASATAALVWHYKGALAPAQVIQTLRSTGVTLPRTADFCLGGAGCGQVSRISLCGAASSASGVNLGCVAVHVAAGAGKNGVLTATEEAAVTALATASYDGKALTNPVVPPSCATPLLTMPAGFRGRFGCPLDQLPNATLLPGVAPQPSTDPCGACSLATNVLQMAINEKLTDPVVPQTLLLSDKNRVAVARYDVGAATDASGKTLRAGAGLSPGSVYEVVMPTIKPVYGTDYSYATLEWVPAPRVQTTSEVVVIQ